MKRLGCRIGSTFDSAARRARNGGGRILRDRIYGNQGQLQSHGYFSRNGASPATVNPPPTQNYVEVAVEVNPSGIGAGVTMSVVVEQSQDGVTWWPLGGMASSDLAATIAAVNRDGTVNNPVCLRLTEQVYRGDVFAANSWSRSHLLDGGTYQYYQLALESQLRVTVTTSAPVYYTVEQSITQNPPPPIPLGQQSASLVGTFAAAESAPASSVTSGSRATIAGTLVTAAGGTWHATATKAIALTDNKSNSFTEPTEKAFSSGAGSFSNISFAYNMGGTRGASHTVTNTPAASTGCTVGGQEWDGIDTSPTVASSTAGGTGTAVSASVVVGASSLACLIFGYDGATTTFDVNGSSLALEIDENNDQQACAVYYKVAQTGTPSVAATIAASRTWGAIIVTFTESGVAAVGKVIGRRRNNTLLRM